MVQMSINVVDPVSYIRSPFGHVDVVGAHNAAEGQLV